MRLLVIVPAVAPLVRDGGVAEGILALSRALARMGCQVTVAVPASPALDLAAVRWSADFAAPAGSAARLRYGELGNGARVLLIATGAPAPRGNPGGAGDAWGCDTDDRATAEHFARFCQAVVAHVDASAAAGAPYAVVHAHDWPGAPALHLLASRRAPAPATVLTIHNLVFQGIYPREAGRHLGPSVEGDAHAALDSGGKLNFLRAGIVSADLVLTVSPTYAREIVRPGLGEGLHAELAARGPTLRGLANGIDDALWDPARDPHLAARYDAGDPSGKRACKAALLAELGLAGRGEAPLAVSLGRIDAQKGSDVLAEALGPLAANDVTTLVAGSGDADLARGLERAAREAGPRARYLGYVPEPLAHRLIAAADVVLLPSRFEPCGIVQMYAQRYGALPVARRTGGLGDTIVDCDVDPARGTGILFGPLGAGAVVDATLRGIAARRAPSWPEVEQRLLRLPLGWGRAAMHHRMLYDDLATKRARHAGSGAT